MFLESLKIPPFESSFKMEIFDFDVQEVAWKIIVDVKK